MNLKRNSGLFRNEASNSQILNSLECEIEGRSRDEEILIQDANEAKITMSEVNEHFRNHSQGVPSLVVHPSMPWRPFPDSKPMLTVLALVLSASQYQCLNGKEKLLDTFIPHTTCPSPVYQNTHIGIWDTSQLLIN